MALRAPKTTKDNELIANIRGLWLAPSLRGTGMRLE